MINKRSILLSWNERVFISMQSIYQDHYHVNIHCTAYTIAATQYLLEGLDSAQRHTADPVWTLASASGWTAWGGRHPSPVPSPEHSSSQGRCESEAAPWALLSCQPDPLSLNYGISETGPGPLPSTPCLSLSAVLFVESLLRKKICLTTWKKSSL